MDFQSLNIRLNMMSVLRNTLDTPLIRAYRSIFSAQNASDFANAYGELCALTYENGNAADLLTTYIASDNNALTKSLANPSDEIMKAASIDIETLSEIISLTSKDFQGYFQNDLDQSFINLPPFTPCTKKLPFSNASELEQYYKENGYGFFAKAPCFSTHQNGEIIPVLHPDPIRLSDFKGYEMQRNQVVNNTLAFLNNKPANNILLYGDKGTGKSSTVKAIAHEYANNGLKIIELSPRHIHIFPKLCEMVSESPYKFIVFMDDLSFDREDDQFAILKAFIEGGLTGKPDNMLLYATSNRRHLVRESFSDRQGDDIHVRDTLETITSLSDRFGLQITFSVPDKDEYLHIVDELAASYGLDMPKNELHLLAERFALRRNGRSPRTAQQFIRHQLMQ